MQFLFGLGSGSTSEASFLGDRGNYYQRYGPLAGLGRTHISKTIAELGFVGLAVLLIFFITLLRQIRRVDRLHESFLATDIYMVILINILMMAFYTTVLVSSITMFVLGYFIALIQSKLNTIIERGS
jgi:O-antigen ligase